MNKPLILVVEDDRSVNNLITTILKTHDYRYLTALNGPIIRTSYSWIWDCRIRTEWTS